MHKKECRQRLINFTVPIRKTKQKNQTSFNFVDNWDNQTSHIWVTIKTFISKGIYYLYHCNHKKKEYKNFHQRRSRVNISCKLHHSKSQPATLSNQHLGNEAVAFEWTYADTSQIAKKKKKKKKKVNWKQKTNYYCLQVFNDVWTPLQPPRKYWILFSWDRSLPIVISRIPTKLFWILVKFSNCLPNTFQQRRSLCG